MKVLLHLGRTDLGCPRQIYDLYAFIPKEIELALPVVSHYENIDMVFVNIGALLLPAVLGNYKIDISDRFKQLLSLLICEIAFLLLGIPVEFIS